MSKKIAVYGGIGCLTIIIILFISACTSLIGAQKKAQQKAQELNKTNVVNEETNQNTEQNQETEKKKYGTININNSEYVIVWTKPTSSINGSMGTDRIPNGTKVEILQKKETNEATYYEIFSTIGKLSVLSTNFNTRKKQMESLPENEWFVEADEYSTISGWIYEEFIELEADNEVIEKIEEAEEIITPTEQALNTNNQIDTDEIIKTDENTITKEVQQEGKDFFDEMIEVGLITKYEIDSDLDTLWVHMTPGQWNFIDNKRDFVAGLYVTSKEKFGLYDVNIQNYNDFDDVYGYGGPTRIKIY